MKVVEIFDSIEGEGRRAGELTSFIRLAGCNLRCNYCDTCYAQNERSDNLHYSADEILHQVNFHNVTVTGGEPLIHEGIHDLLLALCSKGFFVNVETNGSIDILPSKQHVMRLNTIINLPFYTVGVKCPDSGELGSFNVNNLQHLTPKDTVKFVVGSQLDLEYCKLQCQLVNCPVYISPVLGKIDPKVVVKYLLLHKDEMSNCRLSLQLHKYIWGPSERGGLD